MEAAAAALLHGWDPVAFLDMDPRVEWPLAVAVLQRAENLRVEREHAFLKAMEAAVGNGVARAFGGR